MANGYKILIMDEKTGNIEYFDRLKTSYGGHRIITSATFGKVFSSTAEAEAACEIIGQYYNNGYLLEIIEYCS